MGERWWLIKQQLSNFSEFADQRPERTTGKMKENLIHTAQEEREAVAAGFSIFIF